MSLVLVVYIKGYSFLVRAIRDKIIYKQYYIKYQQKFIKPRKPYTPLTIVSTSYSLIILIFSKYIYISFLASIIKPRYLVNNTSNLYFLRLYYSLTSYSLESILLTLSLQSQRELELQIRMLSIQAKQKLSKESLKTQLIYF